MKILIVEDEMAFAMTLEQILQRAGHEAEIVPRLDAALVALSKYPFGGVLMDLQLEDSGWQQTAARVGEVLEIRPDARLVVMSGYQVDADALVIAGARDVIEKGNGQFFRRVLDAFNGDHPWADELR
jgi:ActR/RegA family two-component response regulator